jgi:hypothetical protein
MNFRLRHRLALTLRGEAMVKVGGKTLLSGKETRTQLVSLPEAGLSVTELGRKPGKETRTQLVSLPSREEYTTHRDRKEIVRQLVDRVVVPVERDSNIVGVTLHWQGLCKSGTTRHPSLAAVDA